MDPRVPALLLVLGASLTGCLGDGDTPAAAGLDGPGPSEDEPLDGLLAGGPPTADAPAWALGDAWAIRPMGEGGDAEPSVLVVTAADADGYTLSTTSEGAAGYDALHDVSYLGRIRAADLAGSQDGVPVAFFSFPLTDGKTWTTTWDDREIALTATFVPAMGTSVGIHPGFAIEGKHGDEVYVKYDYVPMLKWWSHLSFASGFGFQVERTQAAWTGAYLAAEVKTLLESGPAAPVASPHAGTFTVDEGASLVNVALTGSAAAFARAWVFVDPEGAPHQTQAANAQATTGDLALEETFPPTPGEWRFVAPVAHTPEGGFVLTVKQVTLTPVAFP